MKKIAGLALATLLASMLGCADFVGPTPMRGADVTANDQAPEIKTYAAKVPGVGEPQLVQRTFLGQPPVIPHSIEQYVPMSQEENACLDCHLTEELRGKKVPRVGASHFSKTEKKANGQPVVEMSRYQCDSCHVPQVDAKPLVDSQFIGVTK